MLTCIVAPCIRRCESSTRATASPGSKHKTRVAHYRQMGPQPIQHLYCRVSVGGCIWSCSLLATADALYPLHSYPMSILNYSGNRPLHPPQPTKYPIVLCHGFSGFDGLLYIPTHINPTFSPLTLPPWLNTIITKFAPPPAPPSQAELSEMSSTLSVASKQHPKTVTTTPDGKFIVEYWNGIKSYLETSHHCITLVAKVPPFANINTRAYALHKYILSQLPMLESPSNNNPVKINLVAHSMGGLDARLLIANFNNPCNEKYEIVSLTTLSTPHHGTAAANLAISLVPQTFVDKFFPSVNQLTPEYLARFNQLITDDPNVKYFSYGAKFEASPTSIFYLPWLYVTKYEGPNDGLISLKSAHWGRWMGYVPDVDHADLINWHGPEKQIQSILGVSNFNATFMYSDIINNLALNDL